MLRIFAGCDAAVVAANAVAVYICMIKVRGQPGYGRVAVVAIIATRDMGRMFACRRDAIVTRTAATQYLCMVDSKRWRPHRHTVAVLADIGRQHMSGILTRCGDAIVAVTTASGDVGMIKISWQPGRTGVAVFTDITASDMCRALTSGSYSIVTTAAITNDAGMVKVGGNPPGSRMAVITGIGTAYVRRVFPGRGDTIVAGSAATDDLSVVDRYRWGERDNAMAVLANCSGLNMCSILAGRIGAVVTADAVTRDIDVVKVRRCPGNSGVAVVTGISAADMRRRFAGCDIAIVAGLAGSYNLSMINHSHR